MAGSGTNEQKFLKRHKSKLQTLAFAAILVLPFLLYMAAQAQHPLAVSVLVGLMAVVMLAIALIS